MIRYNEGNCWEQIVENKYTAPLETCFSEQPLLYVQATEIQSNQYLISAYEPTNLITTCMNKKPKIYTFVIQGLTILELSQHCSAKIQQYYFPATNPLTKHSVPEVGVLKAFPKQRLLIPETEERPEKIVKETATLAPLDIRPPLIKITPSSLGTTLLLPSAVQSLKIDQNPADSAEVDMVNMPVIRKPSRRVHKPIRVNRHKQKQKQGDRATRSPVDEDNRDDDEDEDQTNKARKGTSPEDEQQANDDQNPSFFSWFAQNFDVGDKFSLSTSIIALIFSTGLLVKDIWHMWKNRQPQLKKSHRSRDRTGRSPSDPLPRRPHSHNKLRSAEEITRQLRHLATNLRTGTRNPSRPIASASV
jgi:hypothetical protein